MKMLKMSRIAVVFVLCGVLSVHGGFPDDPKPCKHGDSECILKVINYYIKEKSTKGDKDINMDIIDPMKIANMHIKQGEESPVNIELTIKDSLAHGISTMTFKKIRGFGKDIAKKHELLFTADRLSLEGPYEIKGKVLILPIVGSGNSNLTIVNASLRIVFTGKPYEKDGETYMEATDLKLSTKPGRIYYHFDNLFNGDKALGDNMNSFLNSNWEAIFVEVQKSFEDAFADIFQTIISKIFSKYPYEKFFDA